MTGLAATNENRSLAPEQLTGRTRSHLIEVSHPRCTLHPEAAAAFLAMRTAAAAAGIELLPASSFRDFDRQVTIWNDKFAGRRPLLDRNSLPLDRGALSDGATVEAILNWSALPGASRHHWGTEVDVFDGAAVARGEQPLLIPQEYAPGGPFGRSNDWLTRHAADYGFFRPYDLDRGGVQPEPWHLSYAPIAQIALAALTVDVLEQALKGVSLGGAAIVSARLDIIHARYVAGVATATRAALAASYLKPALDPAMDPAVNPAARPS